MLRTIFTIGLFAVLGVVALGFLFNIFTALIALAIFLLVLAFKIALIGLVIYVVIRIVSPETARRMRARWSGSGI
jgi:hypothetical protein